MDELMEQALRWLPWNTQLHLSWLFLIVDYFIFGATNTNGGMYKMNKKVILVKFSYLLLLR